MVDRAWIDRFQDFVISPTVQVWMSIVGGTSDIGALQAMADAAAYG